MRTKAKVLSDLVLQGNDLFTIMTRDLFLCVAFSLFIALCSQLSFPIPFSPVPVTGQTFAVILTALVLGSNRGVAALLLYTAQGAAGLPVFAPGGTLGIARLAGPTGGYLIGFIAMAWFLGFMAERGWDRGVFNTLFIMILAEAVLYSFGILRLSAFMPGDKLLSAGLYPFIAGDIMKIAFVSFLFPAVWKQVNK